MRCRSNCMKCAAVSRCYLWKSACTLRVRASEEHAEREPTICLCSMLMLDPGAYHDPTIEESKNRQQCRKTHCLVTGTKP